MTFLDTRIVARPGDSLADVERQWHWKTQASPSAKRRIAAQRRSLAQEEQDEGSER